MVKHAAAHMLTRLATTALLLAEHLERSTYDDDLHDAHPVVTRPATGYRLGTRWPS